MLFDVTTSDGVLHHAIAESCKTGLALHPRPGDRQADPDDRSDPREEGAAAQGAQHLGDAADPARATPGLRSARGAKDWKGKKGPDGKPYTIGCIWTPSQLHDFTVTSARAQVAATTGRR